MSIFETFLISTLTTSVGFLFYILRLKYKEQTKTKAELEINKRNAFRKLLDEHSQLVLDLSFDRPHNKWLEDFSTMSKDILTWASDEVLYEYGKYVERYHSKDKDILERELYFARAILAFRKSLGYKNKKGKITPEQIIYIFRCGINNKKI